MAYTVFTYPVYDFVVVTRALFRFLCLGVSISAFGLCVKYVETVLRLVVLVVAVTVGPGCERLVRFVILVVEFSRAWGVSCSFIVYLDLFFVIVRLVVLVAKVIAALKVLWNF